MSIRFVSLLSSIILMSGCVSVKRVDETNMHPEELFESGSIDATEGGETRTYAYRLLRPVDPAGNGDKPLVVFLHGMGERGSNNVDQLDYLPTWMCEPSWRERYQSFVLAVQCPGNELWVKSWDECGVPCSLIAVERVIEELIENEDIDPSRVYLTGLSMGAYGSWALAAHRPDLFAGLVPICGGGDPSTVEQLRGIPIWVFHGTSDTVVRESESIEMVSALRSAGIPVGYTPLVGAGHDSWTDAYLREGAINWLFSQQRP